MECLELGQRFSCHHLHVIEFPIKCLRFFGCYIKISSTTLCFRTATDPLSLSSLPFVKWSKKLSVESRMSYNYQNLISYELNQNLSKICNESQNLNLLQSQTRFYGSACEFPIWPRSANLDTCACIAAQHCSTTKVDLLPRNPISSILFGPCKFYLANVCVPRKCFEWKYLFLLLINLLYLTWWVLLV